MVCKYCGAQIPDSSQFCPYCGKSVIREAPACSAEFDRKAFKDNAKKALSGKYWYAFLVSFVSALVVGGLSIGYQIGNVGTALSQFSTHFQSPARSVFPRYNYLATYINPAIVGALIAIILVALLTAFIFGLIYMFFLANPFIAGKTKFYVDYRSGRCELGNMAYAFKGGRYLNIVKSMAWRILFLFLWTLLFYIPGIIKFYSYYLVPYILADNPGIGYKRALTLSMDMTRGYKWKIFVLQLSFIGWYLLGAICFGIGVLFVTPYYEATIAEMYATLRTKALAAGLCTSRELNLEDIAAQSAL